MTNASQSAQRHMAGKTPRMTAITWPAYAAFAWSLAFAVISLQWALGGTVGGETLGPGIMALALAHDPETMTFLWVSIVGKVAIAVLALALVQRWGRLMPGRLLVIAAWGTAISLLLYGIGNEVQHALMLVGVLPIASLLASTTAVLWHMLLWDPWWTLGGVLFLLVARHFHPVQHKLIPA